MAADASLAVDTNSTPRRRPASIRSISAPLPGTPKQCRTPRFQAASMSASGMVMIAPCRRFSRRFVPVPGRAAAPGHHVTSIMSRPQYTGPRYTLFTSAIAAVVSSGGSRLTA